VFVNRVDVRVTEDFANSDFSGFRDLSVSDALLALKHQIDRRRMEAAWRAEDQLAEAIAALKRGDTSVIESPSAGGDELTIAEDECLVAMRRERVTLTLTLTFDAEESVLIADLPEAAREALASPLAS
jgi:hypothetical protein